MSDPSDLELLREGRDLLRETEAENLRLRALLGMEHAQVAYLSGRLGPVDPHPADCPVCAALGAGRQP